MSRGQNNNKLSIIASWILTFALVVVTAYVNYLSGALEAGLRDLKLHFTTIIVTSVLTIILTIMFFIKKIQYQR